MLFIFSTTVLIKHLWQLKILVFLHWFLICAVPLGACNILNSKNNVLKEVNLSNSLLYFCFKKTQFVKPSCCVKGFYHSNPYDESHPGWPDWAIFSNSATIGSSESSPKMATFSFIFLIQFLHSYLNKKFQNIFCCWYFQVSKVGLWHFLALQKFWLLSKVEQFSPKLLVTLVSP